MLSVEVPLPLENEDDVVLISKLDPDEAVFVDDNGTLRLDAECGLCEDIEIELEG